MIWDGATPASCGLARKIHEIIAWTHEISGFAACWTEEESTAAAGNLPRYDPLSVTGGQLRSTRAAGGLSAIPVILAGSLNHSYPTT